jgi:hypothetical protein
LKGSNVELSTPVTTGGGTVFFYFTCSCILTNFHNIICFVGVSQTFQGLNVSVGTRTSLIDPLGTLPRQMPTGMCSCIDKDH